MQKITSTDFVRNARSVLDALPAEGEIIIERHGVEVARLSSIRAPMTVEQVFALHAGKNAPADDTWYEDCRRLDDEPRDPWAAAESATSTKPSAKP
ncbi:MAG: type II toxin-antitoxin system Phd/YefM family antitoxin [Betaproteobacteria bacterium]|nr:MAG: type II toxin-antitoxin system Phd/YefM family antitoxin [Betaproteobacteria bacterium]TAG46120.1 MAG: type II toxin-antitoxin system Phd/YefM family antitoxin [Betaproteobacteria bacterium]